MPLKQKDKKTILNILLKNNIEHFNAVIITQNVTAQVAKTDNIQQKLIDRFESYKAIVKSYEIGKSKKQIALECNCSMNKVNNAFKHYNVKFNPKDRYEEYRKKIILAMYDYYVLKIKPKKLSEKYNLPLKQIRNRINKNRYSLKIYNSAPSYLNYMQLYSLQQKLSNLKLENTNGTY